MNIEKIKVNGHYVWVDKSRIANDGEYNLSVNKIVKVELDKPKLYGDGCYPIIAASPELNLEGVPSWEAYLAEHEADKEDWDFESPYGNGYEDFQNGFIKGYQIAEKELYTKEDIKLAIELAMGSSIFNATIAEELIQKIKELKK